MSKDQLLENISDELSHRPSQDLTELQTTLQHTSTRTFYKVWQAIQPGEVVHWGELTRRLQQVRSRN